MTEKLTDEERFWIQRFHGCNHIDKALRIIAAHEADSVALVEQAALYQRKAEALAAVIERRTELLRVASLAMPAPWPLPRETGLAIQEALATAPEHTAPDPKRRPGMTKRDLGILLDTMGGELAAANARLEPTVRALNTERAARIDITEKLAAANARVAELEREASEWKANWENATTLVEQHRKAALSEAGHAIQSEDALAAANTRVAELEALAKHHQTMTEAVRTNLTARADAAELGQASWRRTAEKLESEAAALRAEVERLRADFAEEKREHSATIAMGLQLRQDLESADTNYHNEAKAHGETRKQLGAGHALLERLRDYLNPTTAIAADIRDHLSGQATARSEPAPSSGFVDEQGNTHSSPEAAMSDPYANKADDCNWGAPSARTDHERAVLEAIGNARINASSRVNPCFCFDEEEREVCRAELARREAAK